MSGAGHPETEIREKIISDPGVILEDRDVMRALVAANEKSLGSNVVDLRGIAMERLEARLERLEDTHRSVIAAAYENLAGTNQVHRAVLKLLDPPSFEEFLASLGQDIADILRVNRVRLVLESGETVDTPADGVLAIARPGYITDYLCGAGRRQPRHVTLRQIGAPSDLIYGEQAGWVRSEALLMLDLGEGRLPGLLAMGAEDPHQFTPSQGTDLLAFFGGVLERVMRRWLA